MEVVFVALANPVRLAILDLLSKGECCLCQITPCFSQDPSVICRHLHILEQAGLIVARREGRWMRYRIADVTVLKLVTTARRLVRKIGSERHTTRRREALEPMTKTNAQ